jgi:hypothetical protein
MRVSWTRRGAASGFGEPRERLPTTVMALTWVDDVLDVKGATEVLYPALTGSLATDQQAGAKPKNSRERPLRIGKARIVDLRVLVSQGNHEGPREPSRMIFLPWYMNQYS